ncbi:hypothetical protein CEXT_480711 [Caerostris extrusa]|uniref:Uncharacterized protein n=1 Tax=Caerostris extrusa TaxID=172846 RepID=A0AAV4X394_CAEEX|nr:hypothetical protein CEXT_480711 [Caerostris extrusa]
MDRKQNQTIRENLFSHYCFEGGHVTPEFRTMRFFSGRTIDEQTTAPGSFLAVTVNFAIFNSLIAVCRALSTEESQAFIFFPPPQKAINDSHKRIENNEQEVNSVEDNNLRDALIFMAFEYGIFCL